MAAHTRKLWIGIFFFVQISVLLLVISKNIVWIRASFNMQRDQKIYQALLEEKKVLLHDLHELQSYGELVTYAQHAFGMEPVQRKRIKRMEEI